MQAVKEEEISIIPSCDGYEAQQGSFQDLSQGAHIIAATKSCLIGL